MEGLLQGEEHGTPFAGADVHRQTATEPTAYPLEARALFGRVQHLGARRVADAVSVPRLASQQFLRREFLLRGQFGAREGVEGTLHERLRVHELHPTGGRAVAAERSRRRRAEGVAMGCPRVSSQRPARKPSFPKRARAVKKDGVVGSARV